MHEANIAGASIRSSANMLVMGLLRRREVKDQRDICSPKTNECKPFLGKKNPSVAHQSTLKYTQTGGRKPFLEKRDFRRRTAIRIGMRKDYLAADLYRH